MTEKRQEEQCPQCDRYQGLVPHRVSWISCEKCMKWYHFHCLNLSKDDAVRIIRYYCPDCCSTTSSLSIEYKRTSRRSKPKIDYVALNDGDLDSTYISKIHPHITAFTQWRNPSDSCGFEVLEGKELTLEYALRTKLPRPVKIPCNYKDGLGINVPFFTVDELVEDLGVNHPIEVMDVLTQNGTKMKYDLSKWRDYFVNKTERDRILNVLSLEISHSAIGETIKRPTYVEEVDLVDKVWPLDQSSKKPKVSKYCLMGVENSYTDFHLDFAGTSVYYTILKGYKEFIFFPPTSLNYKRFVQWTMDPILNKQFLGDLGLEKGVKINLSEGDVLIIPCGWIHGVYTPEDTLVIGGNFLTSFNIKEQLRVIELEDLTKVEKKFRFPNFTKLMWLTAEKILNGEIKVGSDIDLKNCEELYNYLKSVTEDKKILKESILDVMQGKNTVRRFLESFKLFIEGHAKLTEGDHHIDNIKNDVFETKNEQNNFFQRKRRFNQEKHNTASNGKKHTKI